MDDKLPLLIFPQARDVKPPQGKGYQPEQLHLPSHSRQVQRLNKIKENVFNFQANASDSMAGFEPEAVLIIEIAGSVDDFKKAIDKITGLEWLGEWDTEDIISDEDFYKSPTIGNDFFINRITGITNRTQSKGIREQLISCGSIDDKGKLINEQLLPNNFPHRKEIIKLIEQKKHLTGQIFLSFSNQNGREELLSLWSKWENKQSFDKGTTKWRDVFNQIKIMRRWGIEETLHQTGMLTRWEDDFINHPTASTEVIFQIELFYRKNNENRKQNEREINDLLEEAGGATLGSFIDIQEISFHAVKAKLPTQKVRDLIQIIKSSIDDLDIDLFKFPGVMYFRPPGQSMTIESDDDEMDVVLDFPDTKPTLPPVVAILDGVPNNLHKALKGRVFLDDSDNLYETYQPGTRKHGTEMASLIIHGELSDHNAIPLSSTVYHLPIMQFKPASHDVEYFPDEVFFEDRIQRAVKRIFDGEGDLPPQAPTIKIINISLGDSDRPFIDRPSPWARLLDWLSFEYNVLFCVSAGNYTEPITIDISHAEFLTLEDEEKTQCLLKSIHNQLSSRRLLSPAESLNAITVGALHTDESDDDDLKGRIDLLPNKDMFSPIARFGHGFRRSIKPEILFPGGRQLYYTPTLDSNSTYSLAPTTRSPGQKVACDSAQGTLTKTIYTRGTSNATALASRNGARIHEALIRLRRGNNEEIPDNFLAVLIKTLLVHGAKHNSKATNELDFLNSTENKKRLKARYFGYGAVDIERVLACTEQRGTVIGHGAILENKMHEYRFPIPSGFSGLKTFRRMIVTLAWFSPINPRHPYLREAKLEIQSARKWNETPLRIKRADSDHHQVKRGTVQHEVLEGENQLNQFQQDQEIILRVICKKDATENLEDPIPYGLAVTLEVEEGVDIPIYQQIKQKIQPQIIVGDPVES